MSQSTVATIFGTRPEAIKMAPVILELKKSDRIKIMAKTESVRIEINIIGI